MNLDISESNIGAKTTRARLYRDRSQELRETARGMRWDADRRDLEWVADRYEVLARSLETGSHEFAASLSK
jgi:hypothetical protein